MSVCIYCESFYTQKFSLWKVFLWFYYGSLKSSYVHDNTTNCVQIQFLVLLQYIMSKFEHSSWSCKWSIQLIKTIFVVSVFTWLTINALCYQLLYCERVCWRWVGRANWTENAFTMFFFCIMHTLVFICYVIGTSSTKFLPVQYKVHLCILKKALTHNQRLS